MSTPAPERAPEAREALRGRLQEQAERLEEVASRLATDGEAGWTEHGGERVPIEVAPLVRRLMSDARDIRDALVLLSERPDAPGGEREPDAWALVDQADRLLAGVFGDTSWGRDVGLWRAKVDEARALRLAAPPEAP